MDKDSDWLSKPHHFTILLVLVILALAYQIKLAWERAVPLEHAQALSWSILIEGYEALKEGRLTAELAAQRNNDVTLYGFMFPIESAKEHQHFLLVSHSASCPFHQLLGQGNVVEIRSTEAIAFSRDPILVRGRFLIDSKAGADIQYALHDAILSTP